MKIEITRNPNQDIETQGKGVVLNEAGAVVFSFDTLELANKNNAAEISCIPLGVYTCIKVGATHIPYPHISVLNVPNRAGIALHIGNYAAGTKIDFRGCIGIGLGYADINTDGTLDLLNSKTTFEKLMSVLPDEEFLMQIK